VIILLFAVGRLPDDGSVRSPFPGVRNIAGPALNRLWNGERKTLSYPSETPQTALDSLEQQIKSVTNPMTGGRR
jgi:hypothetical protein